MSRIFRFVKKEWWIASIFIGIALGLCGVSVAEYLIVIFVNPGILVALGALALLVISPPSQYRRYNPIRKKSSTKPRPSLPA